LERLEKKPNQEIPVLVLYLGNLIDYYVRLFDLVTGGSLIFKDPDLPLINSTLNEEFTRRLEELNKISKDNVIPVFIPYESLDYSTIRETWYSEVRPKIKKLGLQVQLAFRVIGDADIRPPEDCVIFVHRISQLIDSYEFKKYKFESEQFRRFFEEQKAKYNEKHNLNKDFDVDFIKTPGVKLTILQYFEEFKTTFFSESIRSPIILAGAIVEALLVESLLLKENEAKAAYETLKKEKREINRLRFEDLVDVALVLGVLPKELEKQTDTLRDFRNYVHIHRAASSAIQLDSHYKELCKNALFIILKQVKSWYLQQLQGTEP